jgi:hypothetical protein
MNNAQMKDEVVRMLGNMPSSHPFYPDVQTWVNRGNLDVVLMGVQGLQHGIDLFPELRTSWLSDVTVASVNKQALPADKLLITSVASFDKATLPNMAADKVRRMTYQPPETFDVLTKDSTRVGFPRIWTMRGKAIEYYPTPSATPTDYQTYLLYGGVQRDPYPDMSADNDVPLLDVLWHDVSVTRAAAIGARRLGWWERADKWDAEVKARLGLSTDIGVMQDVAQSAAVSVAGTPSRMDIHGA